MSKTDIPGVHVARDNELLHFVIQKQDPNGGFWLDALYSPTRDEIEKMLAKHNLPIDHCMQIIESRDPKVHSIMFRLSELEEYLRDRGLI